MAYLGNTPATADTNISLTTVQTAANQAAQLSLTAQEGDVVVRSDENKTYMHNGGSAGAMSDYTVLATPTDTVTSVNSATGAVTLTHDGFSDFVSNEHLDWTADQGSTNIHAGNYTDTNTTYAVGDGGLTTNDFTNADHTKLDGIEASADVTDTLNVTAAGALMDSEVTNLASVKAFDTTDYATAAQGTTADNALPKSGGTMTGTTVLKGITETQVTKSASFTPAFADGTVYSCTGTMSITMPTATAGKNFTIIHATATSITWVGTIKWNGGSAPTADSGIDIYVFVSDGTNWYGMQSGTGFA
jgi:hypothetical protein